MTYRRAGRFISLKLYFNTMFNKKIKILESQFSCSVSYSSVLSKHIKLMAT